MVETLTPVDEEDLATIVALAAAEGRPLAPCGGSSKALIGAPVDTTRIDMRTIAGVTLYEPAELVVSVRAGTPLANLETVLATHRQRLAFEPQDWSVFAGSGNGRATVGGIVAANLSGSRRVSAGSCRDSIIGMRFVDGNGSLIRSGGRVMKNVTGYDLARFLCGSWGTVGIITEVTFRVWPRPRDEASLVFGGLDLPRALDLMSQALGSPYEVSAAVHVPEATDQDARTVLRLENFPESVAYRTGKLAARLEEFGLAARMDAESSRAFWNTIRRCDRIAAAPEPVVWRAFLPSSRTADFADALATVGGRIILADWGGGLVDIAMAEDLADTGCTLAQAMGGHAILLRAPEELRRSLRWYGRGNPMRGALQERIRAVFDPVHIFNRGRFGG